jgi:hypothetical protein
MGGSRRDDDCTTSSVHDHVPPQSYTLTYETSSSVSDIQGHYSDISWLRRLAQCFVVLDRFIIRA